MHGLTLNWTPVSLLGLAFPCPQSLSPPDQSHPCITNTHHRPVENIDLRLCQVVLQHEYSFPKLGSGLCLIFSFQFYNLCHKECVYVLFWPGPLISKAWPYPLQSTPLPCPWTISLAKVIHACCPLPAPENELQYYTHVLHISHRPIFLHNMHAWVMVHCSKKK